MNQLEEAIILQICTVYYHNTVSQCSHVFRLSMISLESDHSCRYDYVEVRDGDSLTSPVIGRYCGDESPSPIRSSGNSRFVSDGYNNYDGFFATFQEVSGTKSVNSQLILFVCLFITCYFFIYSFIFEYIMLAIHSFLIIWY